MVVVNISGRGASSIAVCQAPACSAVGEREMDLAPCRDVKKKFALELAVAAPQSRNCKGQQTGASGAPWRARGIGALKIAQLRLNS
jgi:hypothetical protein